MAILLGNVANFWWLHTRFSFFALESFTARLRVFAPLQGFALLTFTARAVLFLPSLPEGTLAQLCHYQRELFSASFVAYLTKYEIIFALHFQQNLANRDSRLSEYVLFLLSFLHF